MANSPSNNYSQIIPWVLNHPHPTPFSAKYPGYNAAQSRTLFPVALGYDQKYPPNQPIPDTAERVLCYQVGDVNHAGGWRCFKVIALTNIAVSNAPWPNPPHNDANHPNQGCVQDVQHHP
jgi:hypothetical protein